MPDVFWIGLGITAFCVLVGLISGARSSTTPTLTGLAIGSYLGLMAGFPLLAIGLATS
jgi:flagellar biosynthesis protein FliR